MIVNNKFRPPIELAECSPIKKTYEFYKTTGNLWESKYLSSKKIARYYHDVHNTFLTGPNSPYNLSIKESTEKSKEYTDKAISHIKDSHQLLQRRKQERINIQNKTLSQESQSFAGPPHITDKPATPSNAWERLNSLPACKLRHVIPPQLIEKDSQGIQNILNKSREIDKLHEWHESQMQGKRLRARLATINRHNDLRQLEIRCGIKKVREQGVLEGAFGYVKVHKVRQRTEELSKPRTASKGAKFDHEDFRGLLHADYGEAVSRIVCSSVGKNTVVKPHIERKESDGKSSIKDLDEFENRRSKQQASNNSSIEVMSFDLVKEFFK